MLSPWSQRRRRREAPRFVKDSLSSSPKPDCLSREQRVVGTRKRGAEATGKGADAARPGPAGDAGRPRAPSALTVAAYLRWHRRRALPGSEVRAPGARAGGPEPIPKGRTPPGWHWRLGTSLACSQDVHPQKPEAPTPAPAQGTRFPSVSTGGRNKAKSKGVVFSWKVRFHPCSQKAPKDKGTQEFSYLLGAEERRALTTKRERHKRASQ
ncbi:translation initiation factor IF-2-like [Camelus ferus]|uniref:Translation initiation factor IF-2-like n=1 Tax=Camelus ferus TaxID=419612 RepID=A0A8B8SIL8_CAMFR|nr:translation initiation factor IF-2-like [Camelus ferus]